MPSEVAAAAAPETAPSPREVAAPRIAIPVGLQAGPIGGVQAEPLDLKLPVVVQPANAVAQASTEVMVETENEIGLAHWWPTATVAMAVGLGAGLLRVHRRRSDPVTDCSRDGVPDLIHENGMA